MNEPTYRRLCSRDREVIYRINKEIKKQEDITEAIDFSQSTLSKELRRNRGQREYRFKQAHELSQGQKRRRTTSAPVSPSKVRFTSDWKASIALSKSPL